ncbi:MAG: polysaccharide deacetylase family protein [Bacteroidales bacterium]
MKEYFIKYAGFLSTPFSIKFWSFITNKNIIFPFYHTVVNHPLDYISPLYTPINKQDFEIHIDYLLSKFKPISIFEAYQFITADKKPAKPSFVLSFDDGLSGVYENAFQLLKKKGVPAIVFLNTDFIDNAALFYRFKAALILNAIANQPMLIKPITALLLDNGINSDSLPKALLNIGINQSTVLDKILPICNINVDDFLKNEKPYLTVQQIQEMSKYDFVFGSHGTNHAEFQSLSKEERQQQLKKSFDWIEKHCPQKLKLFAFPFTDKGISKNDILQLHHENIDLSFGGAGINNDISPFHIQRIPMEKKYAKSPSKMIKSEYLYYSIKYLLGKKYIQR